MARTILETIVGQLVTETGMGKTFAYLVLALLPGGKIIISTGTHTLRTELSEVAGGK